MSHQRHRGHHHSKHHLDILIVVDVEGALANGLTHNVYLFDTNGNIATSRECNSELTTIVKDGTIINWRVMPIQVDNQIRIDKISGKAVDDGVIWRPRRYGGEDCGFFQSHVKYHKEGLYQYSVTLNMEGKTFTFNPFLDVREIRLHMPICR